MKLRAAAENGLINLEYFDASGFTTTPSVQRAWAPKRTPHRFDAGEPRKRVNVLGALDWATGRVNYALAEQSVSRAEVVGLIDRLAERQGRPSKPTFVVLDNVRIHHGFDQRTLDRWLVEHWLVPVYLPPYSPELNPIETLCRHAKYYWRRSVVWTRETLADEVARLMDGIGTDFQVNFV